MSGAQNAGSAPIQIACPQCHGLARVPVGRVGERPKCPRCKSPLLTDRPIPLTGATFAAHVDRATLPILVDFWADWCGPCKMMAPVLDRFAAERSATIQIGTIDTEAERALAARFAIRSIPTLILFRAGREVARQSGATDLSSLGRWVDTALRG